MSTIQNTIQKIVENSVNVNIDIINEEAFTACESNPTEGIITVGKEYKKIAELIKEIKKDIEPLSAKLKILQTKKEKSQQIAHYLLECHQLEKVVDPDVILRIQKCPVSCEIINEDIVPSEYYKIVKKFSKSKMNNDFKNGITNIAGVEFIDNKTTAVIS